MIDCMACLVAQAQGFPENLPEGGIFVDKRGVTHSKIRTQHAFFFACTVRPDPDNPGRALIDWTRSRMVSDER